MSLGYTQEGWFPWLKKELERIGFSVTVPAMPNAKEPTMQTWVPFLSQTIGNPDENGYLIGHSLGCITILRNLETFSDSQLIGGAVMVAGFGTDLDYERYKGELSSFFQTTVKKNEKIFRS